ncbi:MAG: hypothetical protein GY725_19320 [bacterium]|nr:hypothetical protein [bacterium]
MSRRPAALLLRQLRRDGAVFEIHDGRLRVEAPSKVLSKDAKRAIREQREPLLRSLATERHVLDLPLDEFEHQERAIEVTVPWLNDTLWFVPRLEHIELLIRDGVGRGRIWTVLELRDLVSVPGMRREDLEQIGRLRAAFDAEIVSIQDDRQDSGPAEHRLPPRREAP